MFSTILIGRLFCFPFSIHRFHHCYFSYLVFTNEERRLVLGLYLRQLVRRGIPTAVPLEQVYHLASTVLIIYLIFIMALPQFEHLLYTLLYNVRPYSVLHFPILRELNKNFVL